ncbi:MAG: hypothetical protein JXP34_00485, partial [Planctomycetes bacterium]|nr:hypothetical protein [Planctomycetota bacterium]
MQTAFRIRVLFIAFLSAAGAAFSADPGDRVDVVPFGEITRWDAGGKDHGVVWEEHRDIARVAVRFADPAASPPPGSLRVEYWQSGWPHRRIPRDRPSGAGGSGWLDVGDWFQGRWRVADAVPSAEGGAIAFTFRPVNAKEYDDLGDFAAPYRSTLKLRIASDAPLPRIASFEAFTDSTWEPMTFEVLQDGAPMEAEAFNGIIREVAPIPGGVRIRAVRAATKAYNSFDETIFTVRGRETFSFAASDLLRFRTIVIPDYGVLVRIAGDPTTYEQAVRAVRESPEKDIYTRVLDMPEQTLGRAWADVPEKAPQYIPLSFEGGRQHFGLEADGGVYCIKNWISRIAGRDTPRCLWKGNLIRFSFGLPSSRPVARGLVDGCLPMISATWERDGVRYRQTAFVVPLAGVPAAGERILADDTLVLMARIEMEAIGSGGEARLAIGVAQDGGAERLALEGDRIVAAGSEPRRLRVLVAGDRTGLGEADGTIAFGIRVAPGAARILDAAIPYITLTAPEEIERLRAIRFDDAFEAVRGYWRARVEESCRIRTNEPMIDDFYEAHVSHLLINTEREVGGGDRYMAKVGTFHYGVFSNESCMMVSDLDRRGFGERAEQALESWLHYQGSVGLPGDFSSAKGQFYGAGRYEHGGYNQHHGWVLWCLGEHYFYTRDGEWLARVAPKIAEGCEWIIRERRRTIEAAERSPIRAIERGLLPPGRLEDIGDWRSWLSTNVFSWWGMRNAASALDAGGRAEGERLLAEAEAYRRDILASATEAMRRSPVVRLRDGSWIPHVPSDAHRRGRSFGWITETLEGAIHLVRCELIDPSSRLATWIMKDFEDNLYISEQFGYDMKGEAFERHWFSRGGISMQANLLCSPVPYILRDQPEHFLRSYFNAFAVSYWPDTRMMTEHA